MSRLLVLVLLLHHIEGVCKPWTAAGLAAQRVLGALSAHIAGRDRQAATERARAAHTAAIERARGGRVRQDPARQAVPAPRQPLRALPAAVPVDAEDVAEQLRRYRQEQP